MLKRLSFSLLALVSILTLISIEVDFADRSEDFLERRELHVGETGLFSRHHLPFSKFDPRCRTIQSIHRSTNAHIGFDLSFANTAVFSAFIFDSIGQIATHCDARSVRKSKTYLLHCKILI